MSRKIIGATVGTPISPATIERVLKPVKTVNGIGADENGNVEVEKGYTPQKGLDYYTEADKQEMVEDVLSQMPSEEWIAIADITTTEEINKIWQDAPGFKRILMYIYLPSDLSVKSFYGFYTSDMWSSLYGFSFTGEGRNLLLDFEVIDDLGITLQLNINGNNSSVTNVNNGKLLRESDQTKLNGIGTALQNNGLFPVGTVIKIRGLKA